jgi:hypothetical protein
MDSVPKRMTVAEAAVQLERSQNAIRRYIKARNLLPDKNKRYLSAPILEELAECERRDLRSKPDGSLTSPTTWGDQLKAKQVEKLDVQIAELRGELIGIDEVKDMLSEIAAVVKGALNNWVQYISAERRDAELLEWAEQARDRALNGIVEEMDA